MRDVSDREFGNLEAEVANLKTTVQVLSKKIDVLLELANKSKGGLWAGLAISSLLGGFITWMLTHFPFKGFGA